MLAPSRRPSPGLAGSWALPVYTLEVVILRCSIWGITAGLRSLGRGLEGKLAFSSGDKPRISLKPLHNDSIACPTNYAL